MASPTPNYRIPRSFDFFDISGTNTNENYSIITSINSENGISSFGWRLPIPNLLNYESDFDWNDEETDWLLTPNQDIYTNLGNKTFDVLKNLALDAVPDKTSKNTIYGDLKKSASHALGRYKGVAYNPNKQLYFTGVKQRDFDVYFYLSPMSKEEAESIKDGYKNLAMSAAPSYTDTNYFFNYPSYFNFEVNVNNVSVLKRQNLVITKVHLDFTSDGNITWHDDGFPTSMQMTVGFKELNIPTQENLEQISIFGSPFKKPDNKN